MYERIFCRDRRQFIALGIEFSPQHILQLLKPIACHGGDKHHGQVVGQCLTEHLHQFLIEQVTLRHRQHAMLVEQFGIKLCQLIQQDLILPFDIIRIARHHKEQQRVTLNMAEESEAEALALRGALDDTRDVGHHKRLVVAIAHDTQRRLHRGKGIVGNLRTGIGERRHQRGLTRIGEAHQTDVSQKFQLQDDRHLLHRLTRLRITRCLIGGGTELEVSESAPAAFE